MTESELILYQTEDGRTRIQCRFEGETVWLTQALIAELFQKDVRSHRGTQFRQWAVARLGEYLVKGFTMDDERLKNPPGPGPRDYFDELLERIYATSIDYDPGAEASQRFFATVQNKMHWATHGHTAAEIVYARADATKRLPALFWTLLPYCGHTLRV